MKKLIIISIILIIIGLAVFWILSKPQTNITSQNLNFKNMIKVSSTAFYHNDFIPQKYSCDGEDINPPIKIENVPVEAKSLVLIVDDPDAPMGTWNHWLMWNIDPQINEIQENSVPGGAVLGTNDFGKLEYGGPCPPSGVHRYFFRVFALDTMLNLPVGAKRSELEKAMENHLIDQGELMGKYQR